MIAASIEPIRIALGDAPASGAGLAWIALAVAGALGGALCVGVVLMRRRRRREPIDAAFMSLARALAIDPRQREEVLSLAGAAGVPGAVLLISVTAREEAERRRRARLARVAGDQRLALTA
ncbi:MAG: hypothetical protein WD749_00590 [Phycisphaerales bacterium]